MNIRICVVAGIFVTAVVAGVFEALSSPRKTAATEGRKEEATGEGHEGGNCDGLSLP